MQPPLVQCSHHWCNAATTGGILPLLPAQHSHQQFTHITNTHIPCESAPSFQTHHRQLHCNHWSYTATTGATQPPVIYAQTHSLPIHSGHPSTLIMHDKSYCYQHNLCWHTTATAGNTATGAGATQPPALEQHSHHWQHEHTYSNNTSMASIHASNTLVIYITAMHPPPELHSHHRSYTATNGATQPLPVLCSHHQSCTATTSGVGCVVTYSW
jgi:hypothetical protein